MARPSRMRFPRTNVGSRRLSSWSAGPVGVSGAISSSTSALFSFGQQAISDGLTIVRIHGTLMSLTSTPTAANNMSFAFGMCIVNENAGGIGITAIPTPLTDITWDGWLVHFQGMAGGNGSGTTQNFPFDSKAMRKIKNTDIIFGVLETTEVGAVTADFTLASRQLFKLP